MIEHEILAPDAPVELLEGWLVQKMTKKPPHTIANQLMGDALAAMVLSGWFVNIHEPITTDDSEPEPDVAVVRGQRRDYFNRHPYPSETALIIEVADTTLERDRGIKKRLCARAGVGVYWIINLIDRQIEVYTDPNDSAADPDYRNQQILTEGDELPVIVNNTEVGRLTVRDVLP